MNKFITGSMMGLMVGAGLMMMPGARKLQRDAGKEMQKMKRQLKRM